MQHAFSRIIIPLLTLTAILLFSLLGCSDKSSTPNGNLPQITSLSSTGVQPGDTLSIYGDNFGENLDMVFFDSILVQIVSWSDSLITVEVPANAYSCWIAVQVGEHTSNTVQLFVAVPAIISITPTAIAPGGQIEIRGVLFGESSHIVMVDSKAAAIVSWTDSLIVCIIPNSTVEGNIQILTAGKASNTHRIYIGMAKIKTVSPEIALRGTAITITGEYFGANTGHVKVDNINAEITEWLDSAIVFTVPLTATNGDIEVQTDYGLTQNTSFELKVLELISITPDWGQGGDTVVVRGEFYGAVTLNLYFGNLKAQIINRDDTVVTAIVPEINQSVNVVIQTSYETSESHQFEYFYMNDILEVLLNSNSVDVAVTCLAKHHSCQGWPYYPNYEWECDTSNWSNETTNVSSSNWSNTYIEWDGLTFNLSYSFMDEISHNSVALKISGSISEDGSNLIAVTASFDYKQGSAHSQNGINRSAKAQNIPLLTLNQISNDVTYHIVGTDLSGTNTGRGYRNFDENGMIQWYTVSEIIGNDLTSPEYPPEVTIKFYKRD